MPQVILSDLARVRIEVISFFLVLLLSLSWIFKWLWNGLCKDIPNWPKLRYRGALGFLMVAVLLLGLILSMITGARELMTPGAWKPKGATFVLQERQLGDAKAWLDTARQQRMRQLRDALWQYAAQHNHELPPNRMTADIPLDSWVSIDPAGSRFEYWPGARADEGKRIVAIEPATFGQERWVLWSNGEIEKIHEKAAANHLAEWLLEET